MEAGYNDIQPWNYTDLPKVFGAKEGQSKSFQVRTKKELIALWGSDDLLKAKGLVFVEVFMPKEDAPEFLISTGEAAAKALGGGE
jgi:pyruvate decarboxylase